MPFYVYRSKQPFRPTDPEPEPEQPKPPSRPAPAEKRRLLTDIRRRIVILMANGMSNQEIAAAMGLTVHTVKTHLTIVRERLGTTDRAHTVAVALRLQLISLTDVEYTKVSPPRRRGPNKDRSDGEAVRPLDR